MQKVIGIFGGSFDPPHLGHLSLAKSFLACGKIDELWLIPALESPHKIGEVSTSFHHRSSMCKLAFSSIPNLYVKDLESKLPKPSFTVNTLQFLQQKYAETKWVLCLGADSLHSLNTWFKWQEIVDNYSLLVAERKGISRQKVDKQILDKSTFVVNHQAVDYASSSIKLHLNIYKADYTISTKELSRIGLDPEVYNYIIMHHLYQ